MKIFTGQVLHTKMKDTATVEVTRVVSHSVYKKRLKKTKKYHVQDGVGVKKGDTVRFAAAKPISKTKKWKILEVINK